MEVSAPVQIRQTNDCEILTFFNARDVEYSLTGDHLFVIHSERGDVRAGPGDWLTVGSDGEVVVEYGVHEQHMQGAIERAHANDAEQTAGSR